MLFRSIVNRLGWFWARLSVLSREERVAECKRGNLSEEERVFSLGWVSGSRPNGHPSFCRSVGCQAVRPNGCLLFIVQFGHAEWPSLLCCSMFAVQRVLSGSADWPFCRSVSDVQ